MKATTTDNVAVLMPNVEHKNFTETTDVIEKGTILNGEFKNIEGLRRGQNFTYRMFVTDDNKILYSKSIQPMETTEVYLGADQSVTATKVDLKPAETFSKVKMIALISGGAAGYAYAKYQKQDNKKVAMYIAIGALLGYATGYYIDTNKSITVQKSK
jgi:hypothetical protein